MTRAPRMKAETFVFTMSLVTSISSTVVSPSTFTPFASSASWRYASTIAARRAIIFACAAVRARVGATPMPCAWILLSSQFTPEAVVLDDAANALAAVMQRSRAAANSAVASFDIRFMCAIPFENVPIQ